MAVAAVYSALVNRYTISTNMTGSRQRLQSSLVPSLHMFNSARFTSDLLLLERHDGEAQDDGDGDQQRHEVGRQIGEPQRLVEDAPTDDEHIGGGVGVANQPADAFQGGHR